MNARSKKRLLKILSKMRHAEGAELTFQYLEGEFPELVEFHPQAKNLSKTNLTAKLVPVLPDSNKRVRNHSEMFHYCKYYPLATIEEDGYQAINGSFEYVLLCLQLFKTKPVGYISFEVSYYESEDSVNYTLTMKQIDVEDKARGHAFGSYLNAIALAHFAQDLDCIIDAYARKNITVTVDFIGEVDTREGHILFGAAAQQACLYYGMFELLLEDKPSKIQLSGLSVCDDSFDAFVDE
jgi:hypothetical protein